MSDWLDSVGDFAKGVGEGAWDGVTGMVEGVGSLAKGGYALATSANARQQAWDTAVKDANAVNQFAETAVNDPGKAARQVGDAASSTWGKVSTAYQQAAADGHGAEFIGKAFGQGAVLVGTAFVPGSAEAEAVGALGDAGRAAKVVGDLGKAGDAGKAAEVTGGLGKTTEAAGGTGDLLETGARRVIRDPTSPEAWDKAEVAYDTIRADTSDVDAIVKNSGFSVKDITDIKNHVFENEHQLDRGMSRFDADPSIVNAWSRLKAGDFTQGDVDLLHHELHELNHGKTFGADYRTSHNAANAAGKTWKGED